MGFVEAITREVPDLLTPTPTWGGAQTAEDRLRAAMIAFNLEVGDSDWPLLGVTSDTDLYIPYGSQLGDVPVGGHPILDYHTPVGSEGPGPLAPYPDIGLGPLGGPGTSGTPGSSGVVADLLAIQAQQDPNRTGSGSGTGTGSGGLSSYESAQRDLQRLFDQLELEQSLKDIKGRYRPELKQSAAKIAEQEGKAAKDSGIYTQLMKQVVPSFRGAGRLAAENLARAKAAAAETDTKRRAAIDQSFASATGRARAMVLAVSGDSPEMVDALTQGMDELNAFVDAGMAREGRGQQNLMEASAELARSAAYYGLASAQGEVAQEREKTRIQYENTINDMLAERQAMLDARRAALDSAREWYALDVAKRDAQWALSDAQRGSGGGVGGAGTAGAGTGLWWGGNTPVDAVAFAQFAIRRLMNPEIGSGLSGVRSEDQIDFAELIQDMAESGMTPEDFLADATVADGGASAALWGQYADTVGYSGLTAWGDAQDEFETIRQTPTGGAYNTYLALFNQYIASGYTVEEARRWAEEGNYNTLVQAGAAPPIFNPATYVPAGAAPQAPLVPPAGLPSLFQSIVGSGR